MNQPFLTAEPARQIHVWPLSPLRNTASSTTLLASLEIPENKQYQLFAQVDGLPGFAPPESCDWLALALIFFAMEHGDSLHLHGTVSNSLLVNLSEINAIWRIWRPDKYRTIQLYADTVVSEEARPGGSGYVYAFSGGADACASLRRNLNDAMGWRKRRPSAAMLVHGFDIALENEKGFELANERAQFITSSVNVPLVTVKTNLRNLPGNWEDHFGAMVSALLTAIRTGFEGGVYASCQPYLNPVLPWGSNPVSNPLLCSSHFPIHTDGADMTRIEKVTLIAEWPEARDNVRVCWQGDTPGSNCGKCEKCIRTQLELLALGDTELNAFDAKIQPGDVSGMQIRNAFQIAYVVETLEFSRKRGISGWWVSELESVVKRYESQVAQPCLRQVLQLLPSLLKARVKNIIR